ncbi:MAG: type II toxin-antitoxin system HicB family antitoxin [Candidatus Yanofskybacteria bacterium]|nr:type II toxin-antitoxin system HicB family antitoxin [Candidatus Yanofskybacteria bacterium]
MPKVNKKIYSYSVFYESDPDGGYIVTAPTLPGCYSQGDTLEEAEKNIREAIELYIESLVAHREPIPKEVKSFQGTVVIPVSPPAR